MNSRRGFTLIELLIVIGILAVLATMTVLVLNPAELFKQARDSQRMSDFKAIEKAIAFVRTIASVDPSFAVQSRGTSVPSCGTLVGGVCVVNSSTAVNGTGWVGIDLTDGGSPTFQPPISKLPIDPMNNATYYYAYRGNNVFKTYELNTAFESAKYIPMMSTDGGGGATPDSYYEVGTDPGLDL